MTISELHIQLDFQPENRIDILKDVAAYCDKGYFFVDSSDGHCYLFDKNGNECDINEVKEINEFKYNYKKLINIKIPDNVISIGDYTFRNCRGLTSVTIPNGVSSIGSYAFQNCSGITSVTIPDSVTSIGSFAFKGCSGLTSAVIPNSVTYIGRWAFRDCSGLMRVTIGNSVTKIGERAFSSCLKLKEIIFKNKTIDEVKEMKNYPFGIKDESIIRCA